MGFRNTKQAWEKTAQLLHWSTVLLIAATLPFGWIANSMERGLTERALFDVLFTLGAWILLLIAGRLLWRTFDPAPPCPAKFPAAAAAAAKITHALLYTALLVMIASGYVIQIHMRQALDLFGIVQIPRPF